MVMNELKCPNCGAELEEDDCYDTAIYSDSAVKYIVGHCPNCEKEYQLKELYDFAGYDELVAV